MRRSVFRGLTTAILAILFLVLMLHVGGMGLLPSAAACHAMSSTSSWCIVTEMLAQSLVSTIASLVAALVVVGGVSGAAVVGDGRTMRMRAPPLASALVVPTLRALWRGRARCRDAMIGWRSFRMNERHG
ncbi:hypothetical protein HYV74_00585 [Candidatus Uhrbacteria bacterium]|nr:hypothetical protein [Candidatus Uhrbacteria bacterium]